MAYTSYARNPDGTLTFSGDGHEDLLGYGPAAEAHAAGIDAARPVPSGAGMAQLQAAAAQPPPDMFAGPGATSRDLGDADALLPAKDLGNIDPVLPPTRHFDVNDSPIPTTVPVSPGSRSMRPITPAEADALRASRLVPTAEPAAATTIGQGRSQRKATPEEVKAAADAKAKNEADLQAKADASASGQPASGAKGAVHPGSVVMNQPYEPLTGPGAPSGPTRAVPEHEQQVSRTTQQTVEPSEIGVQRNALGSIEKGNVDQMTTADVGRAEAIADAKTAAINRTADYDKEIQSREISRRQMLQSKVDDMDRLNESLKAEPIDSGRLMRNKTDMEKFSGGIALALSDFGATMTHTENTGAKIIADAVAADVADQRTNWERKKEGLGAQQTLFADYHQILGDARAAEAATRVHLLDRAKDEIDAIIADTESPRLKALGEIAKTDIDKKILGDKAHVASYMQSETFKTIPAHTEGPAAPTAELVEAKNVVTPPGQQVGYQFPDGPDGEKQAEKARTKVEAARTMEHVANRYIQNLLDHAGDPSYAGAIDQDGNAMADMFNQALLGSERATALGLLSELKENLKAGRHIPTDLMNGLKRVARQMIASTHTAAEESLASATPVTRPTVVHGKYMVQPLKGGPKTRFNYAPTSTLTPEGE